MGEQMPPIKPSPPCNAGKGPHVFWVMVPHITDQGERVAIVASAAPRDWRITHDAFCLQTFGGEPHPDHGNDQHRVIRPASAVRCVTTFGSSGEHVCGWRCEMRAFIARWVMMTSYERWPTRLQLGCVCLTSRGWRASRRATNETFAAWRRCATIGVHSRFTSGRETDYGAVTPPVHVASQHLVRRRKTTVPGYCGCCEAETMRYKWGESAGFCRTIERSAC